MYFENICIKIVSEYNKEIPQSQLQTNPWHREEEPHNIHDNEQ